MGNQVKSFEDLICWQKALELAKWVYEITREWKDWDFRSQLRRSTISISSNIAEGYGRKGKKEWSHFLSIAKGSCGETQSLLILAKELNFIQLNNFTQLTELSKEITYILIVLMRKLQ